MITGDTLLTSETYFDLQNIKTDYFGNEIDSITSFYNYLLDEDSDMVERCKELLMFLQENISVNQKVVKDLLNISNFYIDIDIALLKAVLIMIEKHPLFKTEYSKANSIFESRK